MRTAGVNVHPWCGGFYSRFCAKALAKRRWRTTRKMLKNSHCICWLARRSTCTCPNLATCDSSIPMALRSIDRSTCKGPSLATLENLLVFPQTIYALNATLDLAALLVLVAVATFLGSEVVLAAFMLGVGIGWCGRFLGPWCCLGSLRLPPSFQSEFA